VPVRDAGRPGDQEREARPAATRRDLHGRHAGLLGLARRGGRAGKLGAVRAYELRQRAAGSGRARQPRGRPRPLRQRPGRCDALVTDALELAGQAVAIAEGDGAEAVVQTERSGFARFAGSEVHQPTLIESVTVSLRVVRGLRAGTAVGNRFDAEGLRELARRAGEAADASTEDPDLVGPAGASVLPEVDGNDEETAALSAADQARLASAAIQAAGATPADGL